MGICGDLWTGSKFLPGSGERRAVPQLAAFQPDYRLDWSSAPGRCRSRPPGEKQQSTASEKDLKTKQTIQPDTLVKLFLQFLPQFLSTFHCRDQRCASTRRSFLSPGDGWSLEPGPERPVRTGGGSLAHWYSVPNVTTERCAPTAAASPAHGALRKVVGWRCGSGRSLRTVEEEMKKCPKISQATSSRSGSRL